MGSQLSKYKVYVGPVLGRACCICHMQTGLVLSAEYYLQGEKLVGPDNGGIILNKLFNDLKLSLDNHEVDGLSILNIGQ